MAKLFSQASTLDKAVAAAKRAVEREAPFSPAWDAAMAVLEDAERLRWADERRGATGLAVAARLPESGERPSH